MTMEMALGMSEAEASGIGWRGTDQGSQMKTDYGWYSGGNGTNMSSFSGLPGGARFPDGFFRNAGGIGNWWSSSPSGSSAWYRFLSYYNEDIHRYYSEFPQDGFSVRCIRDAE